ncbi:MAG: site-2 protease family protein [Anaerolineae bacterium]
MLLTFLQMIQQHADVATEIIPYLVGLSLAMVCGITFHEFSHAFTAYQLGDMTPRYQGRLTLNPAAHLDPMGVLLFALAGFGWGRPVQFNPVRLRTNPRTGGALVAIAGPIANILLGTVVGLSTRIMIGLQVLPGTETWGIVLLNTLVYFVWFNFILAVFNLVPLPPLDGHHILPALLPADMAYGLQSFYARIGPYSLFALLLILWYIPAAGNILTTPASAMMRLVLGFNF